MREMYAHIAHFVEACRGAAITLIQHLEKSRPDPPVSSVTLRPLRRLLTPEARMQVLTHVPTASCTIKAFSAAVDKAEKAMWLCWQWEGAPDSHVHPDKKADLLLRNTVAHTTPTAALKVPLGAWVWSHMPGGDRPQWHLLARAKLWTDVQFSAIRRQLASAPTQWRIGDAPDDMLTLFPVRGATFGGPRTPKFGWVPQGDGEVTQGVLLGRVAGISSGPGTAKGSLHPLQRTR